MNEHKASALLHYQAAVKKRLGASELQPAARFRRPTPARPPLRDDATPKQRAWQAQKAQGARDRRALRSLVLFGVPKRLRERVVRQVKADWWKPTPAAPVARTPRGRVRP